MSKLFIFGLGYTAVRLAHRLKREGWEVIGTRRTVRLEPGVGVVQFDDVGIPLTLKEATHILSSAPPDQDLEMPDPVLRLYGPAIAKSPARWIGYLSSTGVYGDHKGAWVDEATPIGAGRRDARSKADLAWQALSDVAAAPLHLFRLPGIYGPGRSALDRVRAGQANRIDLPGHVFSRVHVDDIVSALIASMNQPVGKADDPAIYNVTDDEPASGAVVIEHACDLLGLAYPPLQTLQEANLSPMARGFYSECRRVRNDKIKRDLGVSLAYPTYREGLAGCLAEEKAR
jgi:nucleoside-diphosphate-sugar epimerase